MNWLNFVCKTFHWISFRDLSMDSDNFNIFEPENRTCKKTNGTNVSIQIQMYYMKFKRKSMY